MNKLLVPYVEFYITNVCNLSCLGCNRFNNYKFSGFDRWTDYEEIYKKWSQGLYATNITILGGEPLLNPEFMLWFQNIRKLWPHSNLQVTTNGYRLNKIPGLYDFLKKHYKNTTIAVSIHSKQSKTKILSLVQEFLTGELTYEFNNDNPYNEYMYITDAEGVTIKVEYNWWFHQGALIQDPETQTFSLHQSEVKKAHDICHSKHCYHFMHGKLYKCGAVALFPEFAQQHTMVLSQEDRLLMNSYRALSIDDTLEFKQEFINNLPNAIDQCRFCPEEYHGKQIFAEEKKIIFNKSKQL